MNKEILSELMLIPGVGKSIARDLYDLGIRRIDDLQGRDPQAMYDTSNRLAGQVQDRCLLYVFRCAVHFSENRHHHPDTAKLKWWNWKDT